MRGHVASAAGIAVFVPSTAKVVTLFDDQKFLHSGFEQLDAHANAGEACPDDEDVDRNIRRVMLIAGGRRHVGPIVH